MLFDELEEERLAEKSFGSTKSGIAPFYSDKYMKVGVQAADLFDEQRLVRRLEQSLAAKNILLKHLYGNLDALQNRLSDHRLIFGTFATE